MLNVFSTAQCVSFIVCDGGPATHFATYAVNLVDRTKAKVIIHASGPALVRLRDLNLPDDIELRAFTIDGLDYQQQETVAKQLIDDCLKQGARNIITDIGNKFDSICQAVASEIKCPVDQIRFWCYYDNPEPYVPGGYSLRAEETIKRSQFILFANMDLAKKDSIIYSSPETKIELIDKDIYGIGFYQVTEVDRLIQLRETNREILRAHHGWMNVKHLFVYFGGNNDAYFDFAFPNFLLNLSSVDNEIVQDVLFLIHQHPTAKRQNRDGVLFQEWLLKNKHIRAILSTLQTSDQAQIIADAALYYQTSMAPQFALLGLPTMQVGHDVYCDVLVKYNLCRTATSLNEFASGLISLKQRHPSSVNVQQHKELVYNAIGYTPDWFSNLERIIFDNK